MSKQRFELKSKHITIETTNICSANCTICPREKYECKLEIMDFDLFKKIIDDAVQYNIKTLDTCGFGDPFLDKLLFKRLEYAKEKIPNVKTYVSSTCYNMTLDKFDDVIKYIDTLKISFYGFTKETYEKSHRGNLVYEKSLSNILAFLEKIKNLKSL